MRKAILVIMALPILIPAGFFFWPVGVSLELGAQERDTGLTVFGAFGGTALWWTLLWTIFG